MGLLLRPWRVVLSLASGAVLAFAYPTYDVPILGWVSLAGLLLAVLGAGVAEAALCGFLFGASFYTLSLTWIYTVMRQYGPLPVWQAALVLGLLVVAAALFFVAFAVLVALAARRSALLALAAAPFILVALEFARARLPDIGFPWNLLGYTAADSLALAQLASLTGVYGLSFLVAAYNATLVWALTAPIPSRGRASLLWIGSTLVLGIVVFAGDRLVPDAPSDRVAHLVQPNLPQSTNLSADWRQRLAPELDEIERISVEAGQRRPGLVIWPEVPAPFSFRDDAFAQRAARIAEEAQSHFLLGVVDWKPAADGQSHPYNSAVLLAPSGQREFLYDKIHLVPFSEHVPWQSWVAFAPDLLAVVSNFQQGTRRAVGELPGGSFSVFICYEAIFPNEVRQFAAAGAELLINISNDGWFGRSAAPAQHLAIARLRAVENRRWLLRDTNNGYTVSVDPYGRIAARMDVDTRGVLEAPYAFRSDVTVYTRWGDWFAWSAVVAAALLSLVAGFIRPRP